MAATSRKIAYVIDDLGYGGAQKQLSLLVRALPDAYTPVVVSMSRGLRPFADTIRADGIPVLALSRRTGSDVGRLWALGRALKDTGADLVHGFLDAANVYAYLSARILHKPVMLSLRNERLRLTGFAARALSHSLRRADSVLVNSRAGRQLLVDRILVDPERVAYIPNWTGTLHEGKARPLPAANDERIIGNIGRFTTQKRLHLLIEAFADVHRRLPRSRLVLMGDGHEKRSLQTRVEGLGLQECVEFLEPRLDVAAVLRRFHCFVLPSAHEGLPNAAIESLAEGVPIVATPSGDVADLVVEGKTGVLSGGTGAGALAGDILRALSDTDLLRNARSHGPDLVRRKFSMSAALDRLLPAYEALFSR
ncbi:MAG: glycosyltransferase [Candidatus Krumholzibacteriia bacterium]